MSEHLGECSSPLQPGPATSKNQILVRDFALEAVKGNSLSGPTASTDGESQVKANTEDKPKNSIIEEPPKGFTALPYTTYYNPSWTWPERIPEKALAKQPEPAQDKPIKIGHRQSSMPKRSSDASHSSSASEYSTIPTYLHTSGRRSSPGSRWASTSARRRTFSATSSYSATHEDQCDIDEASE